MTPSPSSRQGSLAFLGGGGEMGGTMRSFNWANTVLGPAEQWPQALKTSVSTCLNSRFAILIWWREQLVMLYNDAYRSILADKHPRALGAPGKAIWPEIWHIIGPMLHGVLEKGEATWADNLLLELERDGYPEECYFTFSYSPIRDENGEVSGVFTPVQETTRQVIGERRLRTLRDLAEATGIANAADPDEVARAAARVISTNPQCIPFAAIYLNADDGVRLAGNAGIPEGHPAFPNFVSFTAVRDWPLKAAFEINQDAVVSLPTGMGEVPRGAWPVPPRELMLLPINIGGQRTGCIIVGASPRKRLDPDYRSFLSLVAGHVATAIAEARALAEERRRSEALAEIDRAKTAFFSNVSHEFRTPLTLMLGPLESLLAHNGLSPAQREQIETTHRNSIRLLKLVNSLLDFSRIEAGRMKAAYSATDLSAFTAELASTFRSAIESAGLEFLVDCPPLPEHVFVDRDMWEKIVLNLLSNAFKFTFKGSITVRLNKQGKHAVLTVTDTGTGIPERELPHIFERFHRVEGAKGRSVEGTGIGLALIQELARMQGGSVTAESRLDQGSSFTVSIPLGSAHLQNEPLSPEAVYATPAARRASFTEEARGWISGPSPSTLTHSPSVADRPRILVADDNADMRTHIQSLLDGEYEIHCVADGTAALEAARKFKPEIVLTDVMMPKLDGFGLVARLREDPGTANIPIIMLSARAGEEARSEGMDAGVDDYVVKPFSSRELRARVAAHTRLARARRKAEAQASSILESITDGFLGLDAEWRITYVNSQAERLLRGGLRREDLMGQNFWQVFPATLGTIVEREFRRAIQDGVPTEFESYYEPWDRSFHYKVYPADGGGISVFYEDVTERTRFEKDLARSDDRFRAFVTATSDVIYRMSPDWSEMRYLNGREFIAHTQGPSRSWLKEYIPAEDQQRVSCAIALAIRTGSVFELEHRVFRADGSVGWTFSRAVPLTNDRGEIVEWFGAARDVTARKAAEQNIQASEERLALAIEGGGMGTWDADVVTGLSKWSARHFEMLGYAADPDRETTLEMWRSRVHPEDLESVDAAIRTARETHCRYVSEHRVIRADTAQVRWLSEFGQFVCDSAGSPVRFVGISFDITGRKDAEISLSRSQRKFVELIEHAPFGIYVVNSGFRIAQMNLGSQHGAFKHVRPVIGRDFSEAMRILWPEDVAAEIVGRFRHTLETGEPFRSNDFIRKRADVETVEAYEWELHRITLASGESGVVCYYFDSTELRDAERALRESEHKLRRANDDLEQFAYSASHDLQEPIRSVKIFSELLRARLAEKLEGDEREFLRNICGGAIRMEVLVRDLLAYTQAGLIDQAPEPQDAGTAFKGALANLSGSISECSASIECGPLPSLPVHSAHLQQLFQNLLGNAIKYRRPGGQPVIHVFAERIDETWRFAVSDNGIGIAAEFKERIFGIFKRLHTGEEYSGTGIGLALCQRIVERYHGRIWVQSEPDKGSIFYFTLPV